METPTETPPPTPAEADTPVMPTVRPSETVSAAEFTRVLENIESNQVEVKPGRVSVGEVVYSKGKESKARILVFEDSEFFLSPNVSGELADGVLEETHPVGEAKIQKQSRHFQGLSKQEREQQLAGLDPAIVHIEQLESERYRIRLQEDATARVQSLQTWLILKGIQLTLCVLLNLFDNPNYDPSSMDERE